MLESMQRNLVYLFICPRDSGRQLFLYPVKSWCVCCCLRSSLSKGVMENMNLDELQNAFAGLRLRKNELEVAALKENVELKRTIENLGAINGLLEDGVRAFEEKYANLSLRVNRLELERVELLRRLDASGAT